MSLTLRFDKTFTVEEWIALYKVAEYNEHWSERNARAALAYAYLVTTAWLDEHAVGTLTVWSMGSTSPGSMTSSFTLIIAAAALERVS